jgi:ABC-type transport system involved in cytochrome bd biosynthesis fused ATPase/permease subunit
LEKIASAIFTANIISSICEWIKASRNNRLAQGFSAKMRYDLYHCYAIKCSGHDGKLDVDTEFSLNHFDMRKINEDIQILQDNFEYYEPLRTKCKIVVSFCLLFMVYVSWKLTLATFGGVIVIVLYTAITERGLKKRDSLVKKLKTEIAHLCNI